MSPGSSGHTATARISDRCEVQIVCAAFETSSSKPLVAVSLHDSMPGGCGPFSKVVNTSRARSAIFSAVSTAAQAVCWASNARLVASASGADAETPSTSGSSRSEGCLSLVSISARLAGVHQSSCFTGRSPPQNLPLGSGATKVVRYGLRVRSQRAGLADAIARRHAEARPQRRP